MNDHLQVNACIYLKAIDESEPIEVTQNIEQNLTFYAVGLFNETNTANVINGTNQIFEYADSYFRVKLPSSDRTEMFTLYEFSSRNYDTFSFDFSSASD